MKIIRPFPLYYNNRKIATIQSGTYSLTSGDEPIDCIEGGVGFSDGAPHLTIKALLVCPIKGVGVSVLADCLAKSYVSIGFVADNKSHQVEMRVISCEYDWDHKAGRAAGSFIFSGFAPDLTAAAVG